MVLGKEKAMEEKANDRMAALAENEKRREKKIVRVSVVGILGNLLLVGFKAVVGFIAGSTAIVLDALNNLTDALSSIITVVGTKLAHKKPNDKHPYGYGRIEYITSIVISILVLFAGFSALYESVRGIIAYWSASPDERPGLNPDYSIASMVVIGVAVLAKVALAVYFKKAGKDAKSDALKASGTDAFFDAILSASTLLAAIITYFTGFSIENYLGIVIGIFIIRSGGEILLDGLSEVIGRRGDKAKSDRLEAIILSHPEVRGVYDLILNSYGPERVIASAHAEVDDAMSAKEIHRLSRQITMECYLKENVILTLGIYASNTADPESAAIKKKLLSLCQGHSEIRQVHGFYVDERAKEVSYDLVLNYKANPAEIIDPMNKELAQDFPGYSFMAAVDRDYGSLS